MRRHFTDHFAEMQARLRRPYWEAGAQAEDEQLARRIPRWNLLAQMLLPMLGRVHTQFVKRHASLELARVAVALKLAAQKTGRRPETLAELPPEWLPQAPVDPFTGKPFGYATAQGGWRVWSVGDDLKDDGGKRGEGLRPDQVFFLEAVPERLPHLMKFKAPNAPPPDEF
jgi:hypothetical protein